MSVDHAIKLLKEEGYKGPVTVRGSNGAISWKGNMTHVVESGTASEDQIQKAVESLKSAGFQVNYRKDAADDMRDCMDALEGVGRRMDAMQTRRADRRRADADSIRHQGVPISRAGDKFEYYLKGEYHFAKTLEEAKKHIDDIKSGAKSSQHWTALQSGGRRSDDDELEGVGRRVDAMQTRRADRRRADAGGFRAGKKVKWTTRSGTKFEGVVEGEGQDGKISVKIERIKGSQGAGPYTGKIVQVLAADLSGGRHYDADSCPPYRGRAP